MAWWRAMLATLLALSAYGQITIDAADPGIPAAIVARAPAELVASGPPVVDALASWLRARTDLEPRSAEQAGLDRDRLAACAADVLFTCLVRETSASSARWLVLASLRAEGPDRVSATVFVLDLAALRPGDDDDTLYGRLSVIRLADARPPGLDARLAELLDRELAPALDRAGHLDPHGEIALAVEGPAPAAIEVDGRAVGTFDGASLVLTRVRAGPRQVAVGSARAEVVVEPRARTELRLVLADPRPSVRWGLWAGAALTGLGATALVAGVAATPTPSTVACLRRAQGACADAEPLGPPTTAVVSGASPWVGVGLGVTALGLSWLVGALLDDDDPLARWGLVVGLGLGAAAGTVGFAL